MEAANDSSLTRWNQRLQILAICTAGAWALWTFGVSVYPRLSSNFTGKLSLESEWSMARETCLFGISVDITNKSVLAKRITDVDFFGSWETIPPAPGPRQFALVDFDPELSDDKLLDVRRVRESPLVDEYPPDASSGDGFQIYSEPTPGEVLFIHVQLWDGDKEVGYFYDWIEACQPPMTDGGSLEPIRDAGAAANAK